MSTTVQLLEIYSQDSHAIYGRWYIEGIEGDFACCVGVPDHMVQAAAAASSWRGLRHAWYSDSSDWTSEAQRDAALEVMIGAAEQIAHADRNDLMAGIEVG